MNHVFQIASNSYQLIHVNKDSLVLLAAKIKNTNTIIVDFYLMVE